MTPAPALSAFSVARKWPAAHPERIQLYSLPTPNGIKVSVMLEETGLPYEAHTVSMERQEQLSAEFVGSFPNNKIPAIIDPQGPGGQPLALFESGAILIYLAEKAASPLLPANPALRYETLQWLMFQMAGVGPMFGQVGFFYKYAGSAWEDKRPRERYVQEAKRLLGVLEQRMAARRWLLGDTFTIADIATWPWVRTMVGEQSYNAADLVGWNNYPAVQRTLAAFLQRPSVQKGINIPPRG